MKNCFYHHNGVRGILDYVDGVIKFIPESEIGETDFDYQNDASCLTLDDAYGAGYSGDTDIVETEVANPQNPQRLIVAWVSEDYAKSDEYERMLITDTDSYYDWTSERKRIKSSIRASLDRCGNVDDSCRKDWEETVKQYSNPLNVEFANSVDFDEIVREVIA